MQVGRQKRDISTQLQQTVRSKMLTSRVATTATRINYRRPGALFHNCFVALFKQTHPNSRERERKSYPESGDRLYTASRKWERKKRRKISKQDLYPNFSSSKRTIFCAKRSPNGNSAIKDPRNRRKKEISPSLLALYSSFQSPDTLSFFRGE